MATFIKKENLVIVTGQYNDQQGQQKNEYKTIGEIITMQGDDGSPYQFFRMWGAGGVVEGKVFEQRKASDAMQQPQQQGYRQPNGQPMNPQQVQHQNHQTQPDTGFDNQVPF